MGCFLPIPNRRSGPQTQACTLTGNLTSDPSVPRPAPKSTEPHQPGQKKLHLNFESLKKSNYCTNTLLLIRTGNIKSITNNGILTHAIRMANIKNKIKTKNIKYCQGYGEIGTLVHYWWKCKMLQLLWKTIWQLLKKLKTKLP